MSSIQFPFKFSLWSHFLNNHAPAIAHIQNHLEINRTLQMMPASPTNTFVKHCMELCAYLTIHKIFSFWIGPNDIVCYDVTLNPAFYQTEHDFRWYEKHTLQIKQHEGPKIPTTWKVDYCARHIQRSTHFRIMCPCTSSPSSMEGLLATFCNKDLLSALCYFRNRWRTRQWSLSLFWKYMWTLNSREVTLTRTLNTELPPFMDCWSLLR